MANLIFTGDIMFGRSFNKKLEELEDKNLYKIYGNILTTLNNVDGLIGNLETTITQSINKYNKMFNFKLDPKFSQILKIGNIKYVSLANNHICDYYQEGLLETQNNLDKLNILHSGSGLNYNEVTKPAIMNVKGINDYVMSGGVAVVPGFQGVSKTGDITSIGRGGSDATAVAIAKFFKQIPVKYIQM